MAGNTFGTVLKLTTFGESHGKALGGVLEGCPAGLEVDLKAIQRDLDRRKPGQSRLTSARQESDRAEILSGVFEGRTLGSPIAILVRNQDARPSAYEDFKDLFRPSHADYTTEAKYGIRNWQGGGRASARETVGRVAAGAIARKLLEQAANAEVLGWVCQVHEIGQVGPAIDDVFSIDERRRERGIAGVCRRAGSRGRGVRRGGGGAGAPASPGAPAKGS